MLTNISLERPLAVIDLETTGTDVKTDRIIEISVLKILPDGERIHRTRRLNPGKPIPAEATAVHGITDADVASKPQFAQVADSLLSLLDGCDFCGFNLKRFDLRMLYCEFSRVDRKLVLEGRAIIDPMEIFHGHERRDLAAAVRFYLGREHNGGHTAAADVLATAEVLDAMLARYADLPRSIAGLHQHMQDPKAVDSSGCFTRVAGQIRFAFGKFRGQPLDVVAQTKPDYLHWMLGQDFFQDTKAIVAETLQRTG